MKGVQGVGLAKVKWGQRYGSSGWAQDVIIFVDLVKVVENKGMYLVQNTGHWQENRNMQITTIMNKIFLWPEPTTWNMNKYIFH